MRINLKNSLMMYIFTALLGAFAGLVIWCFLKAVGLGTELVWDKIPGMTGNPYLIVVLCGAGGLAAGILHRCFGDYPEELGVVMGKIRKEKYYSYHPMFVMLVCAFLPLVFGSSVGPEAGLTGIIAALCYWVGDNVRYAKENAGVFSAVGEAVTLGQLFRSPLFGILAVEENEEDSEEAPAPLTRSARFVLYGLSTAASLLVINLLNMAFGKAMPGFPSFEEMTIGKKDYIFLAVYLAAGVLLYYFYELCEKVLHRISGFLPVILKETLCGIAIGLVSFVFPIILFSGEEQMAEMIESPAAYAPLFLIGICILKLIMTSFCLSFGMKGGHFFPAIFACTSMGFALAGLFFRDPVPHAAFAAGIVAAAMLGAQLKKPFAVALLLLLCFPPRFLFWLFLSAAVGAGASKIVCKAANGKEQSGAEPAD